MVSKVNIYLNFSGDCKEAFSFYEKVFRSKIAYQTTYGDQDEMKSELKNKENLGKILHCYLPISDKTSLMGSDIIDETGEPFIIKGNNMAITLVPDSEKETERIFIELSAGGKVLMPLEKTFWNSLYAMFTDKFGIYWMVDFSYN